MIELDTLLPSVPLGWANNRMHFFKYMSAGTAKIVLANRTLRWATASALNDPFEMQFDATVPTNRQVIREAALEKLWTLYQKPEPIKAGNAFGVVFEMLRRNVRTLTRADIYREFGPAVDQGLSNINEKAAQNAEELQRIFSKVKVLSLTVRPDIRLMWSHYADSHRGVVLRLRSIPALDSPYGMAKPIIYSDTIPSLFNSDFLINSFAGLETVNTREVAGSIIYRKSTDWSYEQEWRVTAGLGRDGDAPFEDSPFGANELDGVIFGLNTSASDKDEIRNLAVCYPNVEFMQTRAVSNKSELDIEVFSDFVRP